MKIVCSKTGSSGNFSMITDGVTYLAIDCGIGYDKATKISKFQLAKANALLITHFHS